MTEECGENVTDCGRGRCAAYKLSLYCTQQFRQCSLGKQKCIQINQTTFHICPISFASWTDLTALTWANMSLTSYPYKPQTRLWSPWNAACAMLMEDVWKVCGIMSRRKNTIIKTSSSKHHTRCVCMLCSACLRAFHQPTLAQQHCGVKACPAGRCTALVYGTAVKYWDSANSVWVLVRSTPRLEFPAMPTYTINNAVS